MSCFKPSCPYLADPFSWASSGGTEDIPKNKEFSQATQLARPANVHGARRASFSRPLLKSVTGLDQNFRDSQIWVWDFMRLIFFNCSILEFWPMFTPTWYPSVEMLPAACVEKKCVVFSGKTFARLQTGWRSRFPSRQVAIVWDWLPLVTLLWGWIRLDHALSCYILGI